MSSGPPTAGGGPGGARSARGEPPREPGARAGAPRAPEKVVVPRWIQLVALPLLVVALYLVAKAAGIVLLVFIVAGVIALILNPIVTFLQRAPRCPRGLAILVVYLGLLRRRRRASACCSPTRSPTRPSGSATTCRASSTTPTRGSPTCRPSSTARASTSRSSARARRRCRRCRTRSSAGPSDIVNFGGEILQRVVDGGARAAAGDRAVGLHAASTASGSARWCARSCRRATARPEDDFPTRIQRAVCGYVRGQLLFSLAMGTGAGRAACTSSA